jgi:UDPglucose 6-dehydrogenase
VRRNLNAHRLDFDIEPHNFDAEIWFIAVGTPPGPDGQADLKQVRAVADQITQISLKPAVVVIKSTVPPGTGDEIAQGFMLSGRKDLQVVNNPEFLKEGTAVSDFFKPDRVVIGSSSESAASALVELYRPLALSGHRFLRMNRRSAELSKYAANAMLASRISFMNEISRFCEATGASVHDVRLAVGADSRIGGAFLYAGPGYGGSCFPKDIAALSHAAYRAGVDMPLVRQIAHTNEQQKEHAWFLVLQALNRLGTSRKPRVAVWGLAFKPNTDDVRESPAWHVVRNLLHAQASVALYDPEAMSNFETSYTKTFPDVTYATNEYDVLEEADMLICMTEWHVFRAPEWEEVERRMRGRIVVDARAIWSSQDLGKRGFDYWAIGEKRG